MNLAEHHLYSRLFSLIPPQNFLWAVTPTAWFRSFKLAHFGLTLIYTRECFIPKEKGLGMRIYSDRQNKVHRLIIVFGEKQLLFLTISFLFIPYLCISILYVIDLSIYLSICRGEYRRLASEKAPQPILAPQLKFR